MTVIENGEITLLERSHNETSVKDEIGVLLDQPIYPPNRTPLDIAKVTGLFYSRWSDTTFFRYLASFMLDRHQQYETMSRGMRIKLGLAVALSHDAKLLILDEPSSGLDPVMRDEMLDILRDFIVDEERAIFSVHISQAIWKRLRTT